MGLRGIKMCCPGCGGPSNCNACQTTLKMCSLGLSMEQTTFAGRAGCGGADVSMPWFRNSIEITVRNCSFMIALMGGNNQSGGVITVPWRYQQNGGLPGGPADEPWWHHGGIEYNCSSPTAGGSCGYPSFFGAKYVWLTDLTDRPNPPATDELLAFTFYIARAQHLETSPQQRCFVFTYLEIAWLGSFLIFGGQANGYFIRCRWVWCSGSLDGALCLDLSRTSTCCQHQQPFQPYDCPEPKECPCPSVSARFVSA